MLRTIALILLLVPTIARADFVGDTFHGVAMGQSPQEVMTHLDGQADLDPPIEAPASIPVASETQTHLIARSLRVGSDATVDAASFVFADGALVVIQLRGGAIEALASSIEGEGHSLGPWIAHPTLGTVLDEEGDRAWILTPEGLHPHLFLWTDPHLPGEKPVSYTRSAKAPEAFRFGATFDELEAGLRRLAVASELDTIAEPWLPTGPKEQTQLNLYGLEYAGFPRKAEAVFGDGSLQLVWILTGAGEEHRVRGALIEAYGEPVFVNETFEAYSGWSVCLRKDKPEVLLLSAELAPIFRTQYGEGATEAGD